MLAAVTAAGCPSKTAGLERAGAAGVAQITAHAVGIFHALRAMGTKHAKATLLGGAGGGLAA